MKYFSNSYYKDFFFIKVANYYIDGATELLLIIGCETQI